MARTTQGEQPLHHDSRGWLGRGLARVLGKGRGIDSGKGRDDQSAPGRREVVIQELVQRASSGVCPEKAADRARAILAGMGVAVLVGCAGAQLSKLPDTRYTAEAECILGVLANELSDRQDLIDQVVFNQITLYEALQKAGKDPSTVFTVYEALEQCAPVVAPPPAAGDKVL